MQSLRTRRTAKPRPPPQKSAPANARKSTAVDDRIKKRMSMRYADISLPTNLTEEPKLPPLPSSVRPQNREQEQDEFVGERSSDPQAEAWAANIRTLERADFDPDACECIPPVPGAELVVCSNSF
jgi:exocyst complex component 8